VQRRRYMEISQIVVKGQNRVEMERLEVRERDLQPDELMIETEQTFISAGTELANYTAKEPKVFQPGTWCSYPWKSGYANVGIVREIGANVTTAKRGERVFTYGNHASLVFYDQRRLVIPVPQDIEPDVAASSRMAAVAFTSLILSEIRGNPWVIVFGLGMVGNLAAQAFCIRGCRVIGVDPVERRCKLAEECGIPYTITGAPGTVERSVKELTDGRMGDIVVESVGHSDVVLQALNVTADFGQLVLLGTPRVAVEGDLTELLSDVHLRWITLRGALEWCLPMYPAGGGPSAGVRMSQYEKQQMIFEWIQRGILKIEPLISHRLAPERIKEAYKGLLNRPEEYTGVVLVWK
jgi:threonine dehydrogenase-like Zn-dependent dehydrogenase